MICVSELTKTYGRTVAVDNISFEIPIWYLIVLSLGVAIVADLKKRRVEWLVVLVWLVDIGFRIAVSAFL